MSETREEVLSGDVVFHKGDLNLGSLTSAKGLILPQSIEGDLSLYSLKTAMDLFSLKTSHTVYLRALSLLEKEKLKN